MSRPTDAQIKAALKANWKKRKDGRWECLAYPFGDYTHEKAKLITESCLIMGVRVSTTLSVEAMHALATRLVAVEDALGIEVPA